MRAALCLLAGCLPELDDAVVIRGRHVTVYAAPTIPVCEDAVAVADRFVEDSAALMGVEPRPIDYLLFDGPVGCGSGKYATASCTINGTIYANVWIHFHELAHGGDDTHPPALFVEGLAEALSTPSHVARGETLSRADAELPLESTSFRAGSPVDNYRIAGDFVRFLLERFGAARYQTFARSLVSLSDQQTIRIAFERAYEESLADVVAEWRTADAADSKLVVPADLTECGDLIAPTSIETWSVEHVTPNGCTSGTAPNGTPYTQHPRRYGFEISDAGLFAVQVTGEGGLQGSVRSCTSGKRYDYTMSPASTRFTTLPLRAGRHAIEMTAGVSAWRIERLGAPGNTCETAPTFTAPSADAWTLEARSRPGSWLRIGYDGTRALLVRGPAHACTGSCGVQSCRSIRNPTLLEQAGEPIYLVLDTDGAVIVEPFDPY